MHRFAEIREIDHLRITRVDVAPGRVLSREGQLGRECFAVVRRATPSSRSVAVPSGRSNTASSSGR